MKFFFDRYLTCFFQNINRKLNQLMLFGILTGVIATLGRKMVVFYIVSQAQMGLPPAQI